MAWSTIRKASNTDKTSMSIAAERFCKRHGIEITNGETAEFAIDLVLDIGGSPSYEHLNRAKHLRPLWSRIVRRALGCNAEGISYDYVGFHVD